MNRHIRHLRSSQKGLDVLPKSIEYGEIAINYASDGEKIFIKNSDDEVVSFLTDKHYSSELGRIDDRIENLETNGDERHAVVESNGFYVIDEEMNVGMQYDSNGLDFASISEHALNLLTNKLYPNIAYVEDEGFYIVDEDLNIGAYVDNLGNFKAKNTLTFERV